MEPSLRTVAASADEAEIGSLFLNAQDAIHLGVNFKTQLSLTRPSSNAYTDHKLLRVLVIDLYARGNKVSLRNHISLYNHK